MRIIHLFSHILLLSLLAGWTGCVPEDDPLPDDARSKFLGTWLVNETCSRGNYVATISLDEGNSTQVLISNFGNPGPGYDPAVAKVSGNSIQVAAQNIGEGWTVSGQGTFNSNGSIMWTYTLDAGGYTENCSAVFTQ